jgi:hypothetical protein
MIITAFMGLNNSPKSNNKWNIYNKRNYSTSNNKPNYSQDLTNSSEIINEILKNTNLEI